MLPNTESFFPFDFAQGKRFAQNGDSEFIMPYLLAVVIPYTAITIIFIVLATGVGAFIKRRSRDKCLKYFRRNMVTLEEASGKTIWGKLNVENSGLEFVYPEKHKDEDGHDETSFILYKYEYPNVAAC